MCIQSSEFKGVNTSDTNYRQVTHTTTSNQYSVAIGANEKSKRDDFKSRYSHNQSCSQFRLVQGHTVSGCCLYTYLMTVILKINNLL
jgi:hypothetical protein